MNEPEVVGDGYDDDCLHDDDNDGPRNEETNYSNNSERGESHSEFREK